MYTREYLLSIMENYDDIEPAMREELASRIIVLDKVKVLLMLPNEEMSTIEKVAEYYEVDLDAMTMCILSNKEELAEDGVSVMVTQGQLLDDNDGSPLRLNGQAVRRVGMLLEGSPIAAEIRAQFVNLLK